MRPIPSCNLIQYKLIWKIYFSLLVLIIGFRFEVGADWEMYLAEFNSYKDEPFSSVFTTKDPGYQLLNWIGANTFESIYFVNLICAIIFSTGLAKFCSLQVRPWLALMISVPYLVICVSMGYTRQAVALGIIMIAICNLKSKINSFLYLLILACLFHKSAIVFLPFALISGGGDKFKNLLFIVLISVLLFFVLVVEQLEFIERTYLQTELDSKGALVRVSLIVIPAICFILLRKKFLIDHAMKKFWLNMSWSSLLLLLLLLISPSSTVIDRVALYWIPLQIMILSGLPDALGIPGGRNPFWVTCICVYSSISMIVWLLYSEFSTYWIPYKSIINPLLNL